MHELSVASTIIDIVLETARQNQAMKISQVEISLGEYALVMEDQLKFCLEIVSDKTAAEGTNWKFKSQRGKILCEECQYKGHAKPPDDALHGFLFSFECPKCGSAKTKILDGRDITVDRITVERDN